MREFEHSEKKNDKAEKISRRRDLMRQMEEQAQSVRRKKNTATKAGSDIQISDPADAQEQQADVVAKKVVSGADASSEMKRDHSASSSTISTKREDTLMAKSEDGSLKGTETLQNTLDSSKGGGQALDDKTKNEMGDKMGANLDNVKIHTDNRAHQMSEGINAKAFTHGQDIYFKQGNFDTTSNEGKELLAHELTHTVQKEAGLSRKIQRSSLSSRQFADKHFKGVIGYSWDILRQYLGSDGSKEENEKLEILLSSLINQNSLLSPKELWEKLENPSQRAQLNGYDAAVIYTEGTSGLPQYTRKTYFSTEKDVDLGVQNPEKETISYNKRFSLLPKRQERKRKETSDLATNFIQQTATQINAIVAHSNNSKHVLESDLQNMQKDLNEKLVSDALAKEQLTFGDITKIRDNAIASKDDMRRYYYGSLTVIRVNTERQKKKLQAYANVTLEKLNELEEDQSIEIQKLYNTFNYNVEEIVGKRNQEAYIQGTNRVKELYETSKSPTAVKSKQQTGIYAEVFKVRNEINTLGAKTKEDAKGTVSDKNSSFKTEAEYKANISKQQAIADINAKVGNTNTLLDQRALVDNQNAKSIRDKYDQVIDAQAIGIIETLTKSLQTYYGNLNGFGSLQDAAIQSFYTKSVSDLNAAYADQVQQSKARLEAFKMSQAGLKTPKKKKLEEQMGLTTADITPLMDQANNNVGHVIFNNTLGFSNLSTAIQKGLDALSQQGTQDIANLTSKLTAELDATRLKGIDEQLRMREVHLRQIMRDIKGSQKTLDEEINELTAAYQEQLISLDGDLQKQLEQFKTDSKIILEGLNTRMDAAIMEADVSSRAKLIYETLSKKPFASADLIAALKGVSPSNVLSLKKEYDKLYSSLRNNRSLFDDIYFEMSMDYNGLFDVFSLLLSPTKPLEDEASNSGVFTLPFFPGPKIVEQTSKAGYKGLAISVKNTETLSEIYKTLPAGSSFLVSIGTLQDQYRDADNNSDEEKIRLAFVKRPNGSLGTYTRAITIEDADVGTYDFIYLMDKGGILIPFRIQQKVIDIKATGNELMGNSEAIRGENYETYFGRLNQQKQEIGGGVIRDQNFTQPYISLANKYTDNPTSMQNLPNKNGYVIATPNPGCTYKWYACQTSTGLTYDTYWKPDPVDGSQNKVFFDRSFTYLGKGNSIAICLHMQGHLAILAEEYDAKGIPTGVLINYLQYVLVERTYYFNEDNPYEYDPKGEVVALRQIEAAIADSREYIKKIAGTPVTVKTAYINTESGTQMELPIFIGRSANPNKGKYVLVDLLPGQKDRLYYGDSIEECIDQFESYNVYPEGMIFMEVMTNVQGFPLIKKSFESDGRTPWELFTTTTGWIAIGLFVVGAVVTPFNPAAGATLMYASVAVGAVSLLSGIYDESQKGEPDEGKIIIDTIMLAGSICALGGAAFKALNASNALPILGKVGNFLYFAGAYSLTGTGIFLSAAGVVQIQEILKTDLPLSEKIARISQILFFLAVGLWLFARTGEVSKNREFPEEWNKFSSEDNIEFANRLKVFRGNDDLTFDPTLRGGEGQLFESQIMDDLVMKRWFASRVKDMPESIRLLDETKILLESNPSLNKFVEVVPVGERGNDWVIRGFNRRSIPLKNVSSDPLVAKTKQEVIDLLSKEESSIAQNILKKLNKNSANLHWSPTNKKILIIDMQ